ncbi:hypothetical protein M7793_13445, partial [Enterobacter hormaechei subsp. hoffmannii]|uniref:hypothetical protein n=1 Tax=Enterobacter hormaechei TaxID=158836 RepID=UPI002235E94C
SSMVVTSGDLIRHYHAFSHHNKGRPMHEQYFMDKFWKAIHTQKRQNPCRNCAFVFDRVYFLR